MLIQLCYFVTTTDLVEWLNSFTRKASNHHRGFESQTLVSLFLFVQRIDFRLLLFFGLCVCVCVCVSRVYDTLMCPVYFIQHHGQADTISVHQICEEN